MGRRLVVVLVVLVGKRGVPFAVVRAAVVRVVGEARERVWRAWVRVFV